MNPCVITLRTSEIHLFYNLLFFYWHFLEILWFYIFLFFYKFSFYNFRNFQDSFIFIGLFLGNLGDEIIRLWIVSQHWRLDS